MAHERISVSYNQDMKRLEDLLAGVRRPGDFFVEGALEAPMPRVEVDGVGVLSFPVPAAQIAALVQHAGRAPFGRGEETILDESVRKVWQLPPDKVSLGGKSWEKSFADILARVRDGLGCADVTIGAELYKLLIYDTGAFFKAHRDTEKAETMFGTLVVVLPSAHRGGELLVCHAGREAAVDLSSEEFSELKFAAFYADCEHEVRPITEGNRVCLIYNLVQPSGAKASQPLIVPHYDAEAAGAAKIIEETFAESGAPAKLAWLLEHQYSPAGLSFAGLKGADAALAKVLRTAAERAGCAVHLGIVHIEEFGPAEPRYNSYYSRPSRWRRHRHDDEEEEKNDVSGGDFEVVEVSDGSRHIDQWVDAADRPVAFGRLPLEDGEVLPAGALDNEKPDEQRLTEATGNEGASFARAYHRAALVLWPRARFANVLLQAGVSAALPHLKERAAACTRTTGAVAEQRAVIATAELIIDAWENPPFYRSYRRSVAEPDRSEMIELLARLKATKLLGRFIEGVVTQQFDGSEIKALAANISCVSAGKAGALLSKLARENTSLFHSACVSLLHQTIRERGEKLTPEWKDALQGVGAAIVAALPTLKPHRDPYEGGDWQRTQKAKPVDGAMVADLLDSLRTLQAAELRAEAAAAIAANSPVFDPATVVVPALERLHPGARVGFASDAEAARLWAHAAEFLLARSEQPPVPPTDWRQEVKLSCKCEDCVELQRFAQDAQAQVARFRVRQDRRQHLHRQIKHHGLDMTHATDRKGSPQTLVCTKTRRTFQRQCEQHRADCASMKALLELVRPVTAELASLAARLAAARERKTPDSALA